MPKAFLDGDGVAVSLAADVVIRVRRTVVVDIERPVIQVLVIVTTVVQARVTTVEVSIIRGYGLSSLPPTSSGSSHAAFGGRSWRRQPKLPYLYDVLP